MSVYSSYTFDEVYILHTRITLPLVFFGTELTLKLFGKTPWMIDRKSLYLIKTSDHLNEFEPEIEIFYWF